MPAVIMQFKCGTAYTNERELIATNGQRKPRYSKRFPIQNLKSKIQNGITLKVAGSQ
ncbi:hypothetical protein GXM_02386 [Nostoc sphaeroides CCNUC1]|uniref:Uncharacterized protein n=1 Tax=Nostoc sphaeroides CCNUC1 TaxID=2653204 RepID=A0A5P8VX56_9NOSO|nr:hypothetical protein GXM_02386 [Nostoc sphaeroides CCNUC1]